MGQCLTKPRLTKPRFKGEKKVTRGISNIQICLVVCMSVVEVNDELLVQRMAVRDETALVELHRRYVSYLTAVARRMLRDSDEVQQCVQDAFVNAWDYAVRFDSKKSSAKTWLVTICHRLAINRIRGTELEIMPLQEWDAPVREPDRLEKVMLEQAITVLEIDERELIELAFYQGLSHQQVADETKQPLGTIKTKLRNALGKLRDRLGGEA
jgi:RNA polymerase sigma-70 factor, ECF subfamily